MTLLVLVWYKSDNAISYPLCMWHSVICAPYAWLGDIQLCGFAVSNVLTLQKRNSFIKSLPPLNFNIHINKTNSIYRHKRATPTHTFFRLWIHDTNSTHGITTVILSRVVFLYVCNSWSDLGSRLVCITHTVAAVFMMYYCEIYQQRLETDESLACHSIIYKITSHI